MIYHGNKGRSVKLYQRNKSHVEQKMCYNNVFNIMNCDDEVLMKITKGEWKIAYCFFVEEDEVIDITFHNLHEEFVMFKKYPKSFIGNSLKP